MHAESSASRSQHQGHEEGRLARSIEQQTSKLPSDAFLWTAIGAMGASMALVLSGNHQKGLFIGQWAPTFLIFGLYNKLVKLHGSDGEARPTPS